MNMTWVDWGIIFFILQLVASAQLLLMAWKVSERRKREEGGPCS